MLSMLSRCHYMQTLALYLLRRSSADGPDGVCVCVHGSKRVVNHAVRRVVTRKTSAPSKHNTLHVYLGI